jgi:hypothetical protein
LIRGEFGSDVLALDKPTLDVSEMEVEHYYFLQDELKQAYLCIQL